jgi:hypothetical protein
VGRGVGRQHADRVRALRAVVLAVVNVIQRGRIVEHASSFLETDAVIPRFRAALLWSHTGEPVTRKRRERP